MSQLALSRSAGLSPRYLSELEKGRGNISILRLAALARALGVPLARLVDLPAAESAPIVALIGLRGAGKSTIGRRAARVLGLPFRELDALIEEAAGLSLAEIFVLHGETYYRRLEREALVGLLEAGEPMVIATGGGLVTASDTYALLRRRALTVWLKARPQEHLARVAAQGDGRPMEGRADPLDELRALLRDREPLYAQASHAIDTSRHTPSSAARALARWFRSRGSRQKRTLRGPLRVGRGGKRLDGKPNRA
jgi:XRE family aerobic/anaerobic benzoate catabolism transcriptional regulator